jgi:5-methyltetrahydrofolate--homocysteine methyltransferase
VREEWGYGCGEGLSKEDLIHEKYRGIRPAAGYPDHKEKGTLRCLLDVQANTSMLLTESYAMWPGSSLSGLYFAHSQSRSFSLGKIGRDQVADYHERKEMSIAEVERWFGQNLNYNPAEERRNLPQPVAI